ncbi:MAG TPA: hypothetical protein VFV75_07835 [Candidatus Polarisedimenticolaceae bacterium]|nr:hypothetical protein [Candidatus Polarisedimenticolaceae bacterium]
MILLRPEGPARAAFAAVLALACGIWAYLLARWPVLRVLDRFLLGASATILAVWAVDALQRRYELRTGEICVRYFFVLWSVYRLPRELRMRTDRRRRLVLSGASGRPLVLPRAYNRLGELEKRYWHLREFVEPAEELRAEPDARR